MAKLYFPIEWVKIRTVTNTCRIKSLLTKNPTCFASSAGKEVPTVEDTIMEIFKDVPAGEWANLPEDLTDKLDRYLYGVKESLSLL